MWANDKPIPQKNFDVRSVAAIRPSSVTENLRGGYYTISVLVPPPLKLSVTYDNLTTETDLTLKFFCGIGLSFTLYLSMMSFHYIDKDKIISQQLFFLEPSRLAPKLRCLNF